VVAPHSLLGLSPRDARYGIHQIFACRKNDVVAPHSLLGLSPRDARYGIHQIFACRKNLVEVSGIGPESLSNRIKAATCLVRPLSLILKTSTDRIFQDAAFLNFASAPKANLLKLSC